MLAQSLSRLSQAAPSTSKKTKTKTKAIATTVPVSKVEAPAEIDPKLLSLFADVDKKAESRYSTLKVESKQPSAKDIARERELAKKPAKRPRYGEEGYLDHADELGAADAKRAKRQKTAHRSNDRHGGKYNIDDDEEIESILAQDGGDNDFDVDDDDDDDDADDHEDNDEGDDDDDDGEGDDDADADAATSDTEPADGDGEAVDATTAAAGADGPSRRRSAKEEATRNRRTIFVGNLPIGTTEKELKKHFKQYGKIESTRIRSVPVGKQTISKKVGSPACCHACCVCAMQPATRSLTRSIGSRQVSYFTQNFHPLRDSYNGFVVFVAKADAISACAENGKLFNGHHLRVDIAANSGKTLDTRRVRAIWPCVASTPLSFAHPPLCA